MKLEEIMVMHNCEKKVLITKNSEFKLYVIYSDNDIPNGTYGRPKYVIDYGDKAELCSGYQITEFQKKYGKKIQYPNS